MQNADNKILRYKLTSYLLKEFKSMRAYDNCIVFIDGQKAQIQLNNDLINLGSDEILVISSGAEFSLEKNAEINKIYCLSFSFLNGEKLEKEFVKVYLDIPEKEIVKSLLLNIANKENNSLIKNGAVDYLVGFCLKKCNLKIVENSDIKKIAQKMDRDLTEGHSVKGLAKDTHLSVGYFIKKQSFR